MPDWDDEPQPTCYDERDPIRPWLARNLGAAPYEDVELLASWARYQPAGSLGDVYEAGTPPPMERARKHVEPPIVSCLPVREEAPRPAVDLTLSIRDQIQIKLAELGGLRARQREIDRAQEERLHVRATLEPMRFSVVGNDLQLGRFEVLLLGDGAGLVSGSIQSPGEGTVRLVVDVPRWVTQETLQLLQHSGRFVRTDHQPSTPNT